MVNDAHIFTTILMKLDQHSHNVATLQDLTIWMELDHQCYNVATFQVLTI